MFGVCFKDLPSVFEGKMCVLQTFQEFRFKACLFYRSTKSDILRHSVCVLQTCQPICFKCNLLHSACESYAICLWFIYDI